LQSAYPGVNSSLVNHVGIESFIAALNDRDLEYEVLKRDPISLQAAANYAIKLQAYSHSLGARTTVSAERGSGRIQSQSRNVFMVADEPEANSTSEATLLKRLEQTEKQLSRLLTVTVVLVTLLPERLVLKGEPVFVAQPARVSLILVTVKQFALVQRHTHVTTVRN